MTGHDFDVLVFGALVVSGAGGGVLLVGAGLSVGWGG